MKYRFYKCPDGDYDLGTRRAGWYICGDGLADKVSDWPEEAPDQIDVEFIREGVRNGDLAIGWYPTERSIPRQARVERYALYTDFERLVREALNAGMTHMRVTWDGTKIRQVVDDALPPGSPSGATGPNEGDSSGAGAGETGSGEAQAARGGASGVDAP